MQQRIIAALALVFLSAACGPSEPAAPPPAESPLYHSLLEMVRERASRLENFRIEYEVTFERPEDWMETAAGVVRKSSRDAAGATAKLTSAGERYLYEIITTRLDGSRDTHRMAWDGQSQRYYDSVSRGGFIRRDRVDPQGEGMDTLNRLFLTGTGVLGFLEESDLRSIDRIIVGGHEGARPRAVHPRSGGEDGGATVIEFDLERGGVPARVETYDPEFSEGHPKRIDHVMEFREVADGIFLPVKASTVVYRKVDIYINDELVRNVEIKDATVNAALGEKDFSFEFPAGVSIDDRSSTSRR